MPVVGYLSPDSQDSDVLRLAHLRKGLSETGYIEGRDITLDQAFGLPEVLVAVSTSRLCRGRENANVDAGLGFIWRISANGARPTRWLTVRVAPDAQALFCRRRHQPRRPVPARIRPGSAAAAGSILPSATYVNDSRHLFANAAIAASRAAP